MITTIPRSGFPGRFLLALIFVVGAFTILYMMMTKPHGARHNEKVQNIYEKCNEHNYTYHFFRARDNHDAYLCFVEGLYVFTIKNFDPNAIAQYGDDVVTSFARDQAKNFEDAIRYITGDGYVPMP
jgi:hypothetical protein